MHKFLLAVQVAIIGVLLVGASADNDNLKVKSIEAESITVKSPGSFGSVQIIATKSASGIWVSNDDTHRISMSTTTYFGPAFELNVSKNRDGNDFALWIPKEGTTTRMQYRSAAGKLLSYP